MLATSLKTTYIYALRFSVSDSVKGGELEIWCTKPRKATVRRPSTNGFPSLPTGMLNGGIRLSTMSTMVGAGVLSLLYAMAQLGWGPGVTIMILSWLVTLYTLWQMVEMVEMIPGKRFDRYHELGQYAFGEKLGLWIIVPQQLTVDGVQPDVDYSYKTASISRKVFDFFAGLGEITFPYAGHNVVLEIQATMPSTPEKPSKGPMWKASMYGLAHHMQTQKIQLNLVYKLDMCIILGVLPMVLSHPLDVLDRQRTTGSSPDLFPDYRTVCR
ncbi:hypothetical protein V6N13_017380 [Hibiscus sabdariffa]|uniref:Amino acid transporter transmembrane domain-containing protein n=1 Tax=Hibiscus sabdariffa TaxID=183260 RepID=A0ABR2CZ81_9ROSI